MNPRRPWPAAPAVMGIVNVTPDSFADGGRWLDPAAAVEHALELVAEGADLLDLGAESTRPGAREVGAEEECRRLLPVLTALRARTDAFLSVDTRHLATARAALAEGADAINDVSMLRHEPELAGAVAESGAGLIVMHSRGTPETMAQEPRHAEVTRDVVAALASAVALAERHGCLRDRIVVDPGLGFAKSADESWELLARLESLAPLGLRVLVGASRKSFLGTLLAGPTGEARPVDARLHGSIGAALAAVAGGASYLRVHDVRPTVDALSAFLAGTRALAGGARG